MRERDHQRSTLAQVGAASSLSDTEAGSRCAWSIYTCNRRKHIGSVARRHFSLRQSRILWSFHYSSYLSVPETEMPKPNSQGGCNCGHISRWKGSEQQECTHTHKRSLLVMSWKPFCACPLRRRGAVSVITDSGGGGGGILVVMCLLLWASKACPDNLIPKGRFESQRMGGAAVTLKNNWTPPPRPETPTTATTATTTTTSPYSRDLKAGCS